MRFTVIVLLLALFAGCQSNLPAGRAGSVYNGQTYPELAARVHAGEAVDAGELRRAFVADPAFPAKLSRLTELENQALQLAADEPLKLGSLGTAILDLYYGSLAGHFALQHFYEHVENVETAALHARWVERIRDDLEASGDGTLDAPYPAVTPVEPVAYARSGDLVPVGSIYRSTSQRPFVLLLQARPAGGVLKDLHFDLQAVYDAIHSEVSRSDHSAADADESGDEQGDPDSGADQFNPFALMVYLARQGDTAAQTAIGAAQSNNNPKDAIEWLRSASRSGNVLANNLLAREFFRLAESADDEATREQAMEEVMNNYVHAVALGSLDAAYALGVLYVNGHFGEDNEASGVPLLQQAAAGGHAGATLYLGHLSYQGRQLQQDFDKAADYYVQAASADYDFAKKSYARFLLDRDHGISGDPKTLGWLEDLAEGDDDAEAMLLLGNLHARGVSTPQNFRKARRWFARAVKTSKNDASIVNEVAWVLTVSHLPGLKRANYALDIMTNLMDNDDDARQRPEYLDTWAAAFAANGDFNRAIELQEEALDRAAGNEDPAVAEELKTHLEQFKAGETITETAP